MSILAHWRNATGFNTTDYTVTLGKSVASCTVEELGAHPMCGSISPFANIAYTGTTEEMVNNNIVNLGGAAPFTYPITSEHSDTWAIAGKPSDDIRKQYRRTIFVACPSNVQMPAYFLSTATDSRILIVEDMVAPNKLVINFGATSDWGADIYRTVDFKISNVACKHTCDRGQSSYATAPSQVDYEDPESHTHTYYNIYPVWLYVIEDEAYVVLYEYLCFSGGRYKDTDTDDKNYNFIQKGNFQSFSQVTPKWLALGYNPNPGSNTTTLHDIFPNGYADPVPTPAVFNGNNGRIDYATTNLAPDGAGVVYGLQMSNNVTSGTYVCRLDIHLYTGNQWYRANTMCRAGCYFVNNGELLKPIIKDGIVIGYGTPEQESEIDKYTDLKHPVPTGPGGGGGGSSEDDDSDNVSDGDPFCNSGMFARLYAINYNALTIIANYINGLDASGDPLGEGDKWYEKVWNAVKDLTGFNVQYDPMQSLMSLTIYPFVINAGTAMDIYLNSPGGKLQTGAQGNFLGSHPIATYSLGSRSINTVMDGKGFPFLDYSCTAEIYVPFCGFAPLDIQFIMGGKIHVNFTVDYTTGECCARVYCTKGGTDTIVAILGGKVGAELPITSNGWATYKNELATLNSRAFGSIFSGSAQTAAAYAPGARVREPVVTQGGEGIRYTSKPNVASLFNAGGMVGGAITGYIQGDNLGKHNFTTAIGGFGGLASWHNPTVPFIKIQRPNPRKPTNYGNTVGIPRIETTSLQKGLNVVVNPDLSALTSDLTASELSELYALLTSSVYKK